MRLEDADMQPYRVFVLKKEKAISEEKELHQYYKR
jgi:hypothetical protein